MSSTIARKYTPEEIAAVALTCISKGQYKDAARIMYPWFKQNEWTDKIWAAIEKYPKLAIMGHGSASKTFTASMYYFLDWIAFSNQTALVITSDTMSSMDRRIWADFKTFWHKSTVKLDRVGQVVDSKHMIRTSIEDGKNAIHAIAAESDDAQSKIQGLHTKRVRVIIDEADNPYSSSIWAAISNLGTSGDMRCLALANPSDINAEFAMHCEPENGWDSVDPEVDSEWDSKLGWHVLRLDGLKSPNILAGHDKYPFLLTNSGVEDIRKNKTTNSPEWWTYVRAWYPPQSAIKTIFPGGLLAKCNKPHVWYTTVRQVAGCDPAFEGGDNCVVVFGRYGRLASNPERTAVEINDFVKILRKNNALPITHDYGEQIFQLLTDRGIDPQDFGIDCTGNGLGLSDYIKGKYIAAGKKGTIHAMNFGGKASDMKMTTEDTMKAKERFANFVTELWYSAREWCRLGLVYFKTLPRDLKIQLESRQYSLKGKDSQSGREVILAESKKFMKEDRGLTSPDEADATCVLLRVVRLNSLGFTPGTFYEATPKKANKQFTKYATIWKQTYEE